MLMDHRSPTATASSRGLVRLEHEHAWAALAQREGLPLHIFRLGGEGAALRLCMLRAGRRRVKAAAQCTAIL